MIEHFSISEPIADKRLAWDMAHAEAPVRNNPGSAWPLVGSEAYERQVEVATQRSTKIEQAYIAKLEKRDEDYYEIEEMYQGQTVNKIDLYNFLTIGAQTEKELNIADVQSTRIWNLLGKVSSWANSDVEFEKTIPSGKQKNNYFGEFTFVSTEVVKYENLGVASLVHFLDRLNGSNGSATYVRGIGPASIKTMVDFADFQTKQVLESQKANIITRNNPSIS